MGLEEGLRCVDHFSLRLYIFNLVVVQMIWKIHYPGIFLKLLVHIVIHKLLRFLGCFCKGCLKEESLKLYSVGELQLTTLFRINEQMRTLQSGSLELQYLMEGCSLSFPYHFFKRLSETVYKEYLSSAERCQVGMSTPLSQLSYV